VEHDRPGCFSRHLAVRNGVLPGRFQGFLEDSTFVSIPACCISAATSAKRNQVSKRKSRAEETGLGFNALYESGFTQGTIGVGVDAIGLLGVKLDSGKGRAGTGLFPTGSDGRSQDDYSKGGGAVKFRISDTVLKVGDQYTTAQCSPPTTAACCQSCRKVSRSPATKSRA
jgi:hypothetical protein